MERPITRFYPVVISSCSKSVLYRLYSNIAECQNSFLIDKEPFVNGEANLAEIDLISTLSRCSAGVLAEPDELMSCKSQFQIGVLEKTTDRRTTAHTREILNVYISAAKYYVRSQNQDILPLLVATARRCVPATMDALRQVQSTSMDVNKRRIQLLSTWRAYYSALGLREGDDTSCVEEPLRIAPWQTCTSKKCPCYGKRPCHKLRVCKGCYQRFYCNAKCQASKVPFNPFYVLALTCSYAGTGTKEAMPKSANGGRLRIEDGIFSSWRN